MHVSGWIWTDNFPHYMQFLASCINLELTDADVSALQATLDGSDVEVGDWRELILTGSPEIKMDAAYEVGFDNVQLQFHCDDATGTRAQAALDIMASHTLTPRNP